MQAQKGRRYEVPTSRSLRTRNGYGRHLVRNEEAQAVSSSGQMVCP